jgi:hypothetical protein
LSIVHKNNIREYLRQRHCNFSSARLLKKITNLVEASSSSK